MCSETSPRISFSHDLCQAEVAEEINEMESRRDTRLLDSNPDFEFISSSCFAQESSSADELFSNGVIRPVQIQANIVAPSKRSSSSPAVSLPPLHCPPVKKETSVREQKPQQAKSFWAFNRSCSLNHEAKKSLIFSLPLLSRSNSTGSVVNHKARSSSTSNAYRKPPLKKSFVGSYGNGVQISPVLNVPTPYISKCTANFFGLGPLLRSRSKDKKNIKK